jgi:hypothetical protein
MHTKKALREEKERCEESMRKTCSFGCISARHGSKPIKMPWNNTLNQSVASNWSNNYTLSSLWCRKRSSIVAADLTHAFESSRIDLKSKQCTIV